MDRIAQCALGAGVTAFFHPIACTKILIQLGYEPMPPYLTTSLFGSKVYMLPNVFKYMSYIKQRDGWLGLYRGLGSKLLSGIVANYVSNMVQSRLVGQPLLGEETALETEDDVKADTLKLFTNTGYETISRCAGIIVSHPFHVMFVRGVAQFVGQESEYSSVWSSISAIWEEQGWLGFFAGLVPRIVGEVLTIWMANILAHSINTFVFSGTQPSVSKDMKGYTGMVSQLIVTQITYPFCLVSNVMCVNNSGLLAGRQPVSPIYKDWLDCWSQLSSEGNIKRGGSVFWRYYRGPISYCRDGITVSWPVLTGYAAKH